jgi:ribonuclease T2
MKFRSALLLCLIVLIAFALFAKHHRRRQASSQSSFDFYVLSLSWAPTYCHDHPGDHSSECRPGAQKAFVLHGLWPQAESGLPPLSCTPASPVASDLVDYMLQYFPSRGLIQHEWQEHGTCSGLSPQEYFHQAELALKKVQVPEQFHTLRREQEFSRSDLERQFAQANGAPTDAIRTSCHGGELVNLEMCLSKDLQFRSCTASVRECPASSVTLLPPQ